MKTTKYFAIILTVALGILPAVKAQAVSSSGLISDEAMAEIVQGSARMDNLYNEARKACVSRGEISSEKVLEKMSEVEINMKTASTLIGNAIRRAGLDQETGPIGCTPAFQAQILAYALGIKNPFFILEVEIPAWKKIGFVSEFPACKLLDVLDQARRYSTYILDKANDDQRGNLAPNCNLDSYMKAK